MDKIIKCANCGQDFVWTEGEQDFYKQKNVDQPKYCMICRGMMGEASKDNFRGKSELDGDNLYEVE